MGCRNTGSDPSLALTLGGECGRVALAAMAVCTAAGKLKEAEWEAWVVRNAGKREWIALLSKKFRLIG